MNRNLSLLLVIVFACRLQAQITNAPLAHAGNNGIFINLAYDYPPAMESPANGFLIERKPSGSEEWEMLIRFTVPDTREEFLANLTKANTVIPDYLEKNLVPYDAIWDAIEKNGSLDSVPLWRNALLIRLALGMCAFDGTAPANTAMTYRISKIDNTGNMAVYAVTAPVSFPGVLDFPAPEWHSTIQNAVNIQMYFTSPDKQLPPDYRVMRSENFDGPYFAIHCSKFTQQNDTVSTFAFSDNAVSANHLYYYKVAAMDAYGALAAFSKPVAAAAFDSKQISLPYNLHVEKVDGASGLRISWDIRNIQNITGYEIYRSNSDKGPFTRIGFASAMDTSFFDSYAEPLITYYYYLQTIDRLGNQLSPSPHIPGIYRSGNKPSPPQLTATGVENGVEIVLRLHMEHIRGFRLYRSTVDDSTLTLISELIPYDTSGETHFTDTGPQLNGYTFYNYVARSESGSYILSDMSEPAVARPLIQTFPGTPLNLNVSVYDTFNVVSWSHADERYIASNDVFRAETGSDDFSKIGTVKNNRFVDTTTIASKAYTYRIITYDVFGGASQPASFTTEAQSGMHAYPPPALIAYTAGGKVILEWNTAQPQSDFDVRIYRRSGNNSPKLMATVRASSGRWEEIPPDAGTLYFYSIATVIEGSEGKKSEEIGLKMK